MWQKTIAMIIMAAGLAVTAVEPGIFDRIPQTAAAAVYLRTEKLFRQPVLLRITDSGDIRRIRQELALIPWGLPDTIITIFGRNRGYAMLTAYPAGIDKLEEGLRTRYGKNPAWEIGRGSKNGLDFLSLTLHRERKRDKNYTLVFLAPHVVLMAGDKSPLSWDVLTGEYNRALGTKLETMAATDLVYGYSPEPLQSGFDPVGMFSQLKQCEFAVAVPSSGDAVVLRGEGQCADAAAARACRMQLQSFRQIMLVALFGADQQLFRSIDRVVTAEATGSRIRLRAEFPPAVLNGIRTYYEGKSAQFNAVLKQQLKP
ncbi:MAG: hypothetical protein PHQ27_01285 [Victivallales bacterium]|nr:hypothetical protein [Victivallales bacterium]